VSEPHNACQYQTYLTSAVRAGVLVVCYEKDDAMCDALQSHVVLRTCAQAL
jgi:hypothetical protein